jgi:hypothetical protein
MSRLNSQVAAPDNNIPPFQTCTADKHFTLLGQPENGGSNLHRNVGTYSTASKLVNFNDQHFGVS